MEEGRGAVVRIRLCSAISAEVAGRRLTGQQLGSRKARSLLGLLASERGALVPLDRIVDALWAGETPADPAANVATLVSRLRRALGPHVLTGSGRGYGLSPDGAWTVDLDEVGALAAEAAARTAAREHGLAAAAASAALDLLGTQAALADEDDTDWVLAVRREADELRRRARHGLAEALTPTDPAGAVVVAAAAAAADPWDERAVRDLMRALVADGRPSAALAAYDDLAARLRDELGTSPDKASAELHLAVLRETEHPAEAAASTGPGRPPQRALLGRQAELAVAERAWSAAGTADDGHLLLVEGEAGIGKTRLLDALAELAVATGGLVLHGRCHPAERSLFLQPYVDAVRPELVDAPPARLAALVRDHEAAWLALLPDLAAVLPVVRPLPEDAELQRRRSYDAVLVLLRRLARERPVLLTIDDLHDGGAATVDLLGYLGGRLGEARVLVVAAFRAEYAALAEPVADRATRLHLGALTRSAVDALAAAAGLAGRGEQVMSRTAGHPLSVVETLRALSAGDSGVPESLSEAVLSRAARLDAPQRATLEAAAVLGRRLEPRLLAELTESTELSAVRACEELVRHGLLVRSGSSYEFANDLLQECLYAALPPAVAVAHHRRAAELVTGQPELMAGHAYAAGDAPRAAHGWLLAGEEALRRAAVDDAVVLLDRSLAIEVADPGTTARALLARSAAYEARTEYEPALADIDAALALARRSDDRRLEMAALRARGGDPAVALRRPADEVAGALEAGLVLAAELGDRRAEADFTTRLTILDASRLRLATALDRARRALAHARTAGSPDAVLLGLDGLKTVLSYLGDVDELSEVIAELEPMVRARGDLWLLQWVIFESSFIAAGEGRWAEARGLVAEALTLNRRTGFGAYAGYLQAHDGWFARLSGDLDAARTVGRAAIASTSGSAHPWWFATAAGLLAATLLETGDTAEALAVARRALAASDRASPAAGPVRCLAAVAAATGDASDLAAASTALDAVECPPGRAWVVGADCYLLVAEAARRQGDAATAERALAPLLAATASSWPALHGRAAELRRP